MLEYVRKVEKAGVRVVLQQNILGDCVLQSQVGRMFAWNHSFIQPDDIIVLGDADLFVIGSDVLDMLQTPSQVWIGEYVFTQVSGYTFPMALAAMTAATWQAGLDFSGKEGGSGIGMKEVVEFYKTWNGEGDFGKWSVDQVILSFVILRPDKQLCDLPETNGLWSRLKLQPRKMNDSGLCVHGNLQNCFIQEHRTHCPWWHFVPSDREEQFKKVYDDIVNTGAVQLQPGQPFFWNENEHYTGPPCYALPCT